MELKTTEIKRRVLHQSELNPNLMLTTVIEWKIAGDFSRKGAKREPRTQRIESTLCAFCLSLAPWRENSLYIERDFIQSGLPVYDVSCPDKQPNTKSKLPRPKLHLCLLCERVELASGAGRVAWLRLIGQNCPSSSGSCWLSSGARPGSSSSSAWKIYLPSRSRAYASSSPSPYS